MDSNTSQAYQQPESTTSPRAIYRSRREPSRLCSECGVPYQLHLGSCPTLLPPKEREVAK